MAAALHLRTGTQVSEVRGPFAALNPDPIVMQHFPAPLSREESNALADRIQAGFAERGWGLWAVEAPEGFVGFTGLSVPTFEADFLPAVEVGWRLARSAWGNGYATEAAMESLRYGLEELGLEKVISFTATTNHRSEGVMQRIGMVRMGEFDHPALPEGHRLRRHLLYSAGKGDKAGYRHSGRPEQRRPIPEAD